MSTINTDWLPDDEGNGAPNVSPSLRMWYAGTETYTPGISSYTEPSISPLVGNFPRSGEAPGPIMSYGFQGSASQVVQPVSSPEHWAFHDQGQFVDPQQRFPGQNVPDGEGFPRFESCNMAVTSGTGQSHNIPFGHEEPSYQGYDPAQYYHWGDSGNTISPEIRSHWPSDTQQGPSQDFRTYSSCKSSGSQDFAREIPVTPQASSASEASQDNNTVQPTSPSPNERNRRSSQAARSGSPESASPKGPNFQVFDSHMEVSKQRRTRRLKDLQSYRRTRQRGACTDCRRLKRKCDDSHHATSPASSIDSSGTD